MGRKTSQSPLATMRATLRGCSVWATPTPVTAPTLLVVNPLRGASGTGRGPIAKTSKEVSLLFVFSSCFFFFTTLVCS